VIREPALAPAGGGADPTREELARRSVRRAAETALRIDARDPGIWRFLPQAA
jgi:hypothetical protein